MWNTLKHVVKILSCYRKALRAIEQTKDVLLKVNDLESGVEDLKQEAREALQAWREVF